MPRIDEALNRVRAAAQAAVPPPVDEPLPGDDTAFPVEVVEEEAVEGVEVSPVPSVAGEVLTLVNDLKQLPLAEKLAPTSSHQSYIEQYRRLAARLHLAQGDGQGRLVMVTSAAPGEGKTLTAANLALTLSESYRRRVLLIDADLRRPWLHHVFDLANVAGLNDGLRAEVERKVPLIQVTPYLSLLTAGRPDTDPMSVLSSDRIQRVLAEAAQAFDWVIIDTPPVALLTDAHLLASLVDTVLLVVQAGRTPLSAIKTAADSVGRDRIMGVILNRAEDAFPRPYGYYYGYGMEGTTAEQAKA
jgi:protein-tyrosine kinase